MSEDTTAAKVEETTAAGASIEPEIPVEDSDPDVEDVTPEEAKGSGLPPLQDGYVYARVTHGLVQHDPEAYVSGPRKERDRFEKGAILKLPIAEATRLHALKAVHPAS